MCTRFSIQLFSCHVEFLQTSCIKAMSVKCYVFYQVVKICSGNREYNVVRRVTACANAPTEGMAMLAGNKNHPKHNPGLETCRERNQTLLEKIAHCVAPFTEWMERERGGGACTPASNTRWMGQEMVAGQGSYPNMEWSWWKEYSHNWDITGPSALRTHNEKVNERLAQQAYTQNH